MTKVQQQIKNLDGAKAKAELAAAGKIKITVGDHEYELTDEDMEITAQQAEGYVCQNAGDVTVALSTTLTEELIEEGFVREIISKLQTMRRDSDFNVTDRIKVFAADNDKLTAIMKKNEDTVKNIVLATEIRYDENHDGGKEWNINGETITLAVERCSASLG